MAIGSPSGSARQGRGELCACLSFETAPRGEIGLVLNL